MRIAILATHAGWHTDRLQHAIATRGHESAVLPYESLTAQLGSDTSISKPSLNANGFDLLAADAVLARIIPSGSLEQIIYRVDTLHWLEDLGLPVMNPPRAIERSVDKFYTSALLHHAGLPTPHTVVCEHADTAMSAFLSMSDVIVKPLFGSMGLGMVRVSDEDTAWRVFRALEAIRAVYYLQRAIDHDGHDVRAFVIGDHVIGAIERRAPAGTPGGLRGKGQEHDGPPARWRTNIARGGTPRAIPLPPAWQTLALCAARTVGADYAGVDLLPARDGTVYVIEVNGIPGWHALQSVSSTDVAQAIVDYLLDSRLATSR